MQSNLSATDKYKKLQINIDKMTINKINKLRETYNAILKKGKTVYMFL